jgi:hypothetical protein
MPIKNIFAFNLTHDWLLKENNIIIELEPIGKRMINWILKFLSKARIFNRFVIKNKISQHVSNIEIIRKFSLKLFPKMNIWYEYHFKNSFL